MSKDTNKVGQNNLFYFGVFYFYLCFDNNRDNKCLVAN